MTTINILVIIVITVVIVVVIVVVVAVMVVGTLINMLMTFMSNADAILSMIMPIMIMTRAVATM